METILVGLIAVLMVAMQGTSIRKEIVLVEAGKDLGGMDIDNQHNEAVSTFLKPGALNGGRDS